MSIEPHFGSRDLPVAKREAILIVLVVSLSIHVVRFFYLISKKWRENKK
jgi:hypothetical protein